MADAENWKTASWATLQAGASGGDAEAQFELGNRFIKRFASPKREAKDAANAAKWYRQAAESA